jgi:hypothetical protein
VPAIMIMVWSMFWRRIYDLLGPERFGLFLFFDFGFFLLERTLDLDFDFKPLDIWRVY